MYWIKTNRIIKYLFKSFVWDIPTNEKTVYLTFDDGPIPEITTWVLDQLNQYGFKATFFCIGKNIIENPTIFQKIIASGHQIGNHTQNHNNGWKTPTKLYLDEVFLCQELVSVVNSQKLFRPPYGKLNPFQTKKLKENGFKIIMWDVLSADFDLSVTPEKCLDNVIKNIAPGSIIVFHDSQKAFRNLEYCLPKVLEFLVENGYKSMSLSYDFLVF